MTDLRAPQPAGAAHFTEEADLAEGPVASAAVVTRLSTHGPAGLAALVEEVTAPLADRLTAGGLLALLGDPRIGDRPAVCPVPGGEVEIGLDPRRVAPVAAAWAHVGVTAEWIDKETPVHRVELADYWIARYPVTNAEYRRYLADTPTAGRPRTWYLGAYPWERANHPVAGVDADDADRYAAWLSRRTGHPWRLPTEAEWEHAAAGPRRTDFPWGDGFDPTAANTRETGLHTTSPVGAFPAGRSWCGALDLAGNVEEYVADDYRPYPGGRAVHDDLVTRVGRYRVARGGSFARYGDLARTRRRHGAHPGPLYPVGFRLATGEPPR
ncbi:formylglycine-generating enzyme family protein [Micromonospora sp. WMMA1923]|uniref:formylglycine-generating enzyme family protein n=1 Tax=Micromonospora sp. WMMA1923 TaxID=3404125 RepID=UPI003B948BD1